MNYRLDVPSVYSPTRRCPFLDAVSARISEALKIEPAAFDLDRGVVSMATLKHRPRVIREIVLAPANLAEPDVAYGLERAQLDPERAARRLWPW